MSLPTWAERVAEATLESSPRQVGAVPVVYPLMEELQVRQTINGLRWSKSDIDLGRVVEVLLLNRRILSPQPFYRIGEWAEQTVIPQMFGLAVEQLYDQRFGRALDELHSVLAEAWVEIVAWAVQQEGLDVSVLHWDTTSIYLEGEYEDSDLAKYGHSSDGLADKKQVKLGLDVTDRERVPLLYRMLSDAQADDTTVVPHLAGMPLF